MKGKLIGDILVVKKEPENLEELIKLPYINKVVKLGKIHAIEINPVSYNYLCENVRLNKVENIVHPILGDCGLQDFDHEADRIMMGYIGGTHHYLDSAMKYLKEGGIIHYHESTPEPILFERPVKRVGEAAKKVGREIEVLNKRTIKKYSPGVFHTVVDIKVN